MHEAVKQMLSKYNCTAQQDYLNALKEIFQEIALLGLWRSKFFEKAAFYGGSALRILYGLNRFSEDLDFSLLSKFSHFDLTPYNTAIIKELQAFGFEASMETKLKSNKTAIESAFIKAGAKKQLITIEAPANIVKAIHTMQTIKIKMEVDSNPPDLFNTETNFLLNPIPFSIRSFVLSDLFAGKIHALLCRPWVSRVKGRDWYDFVWYITRNTPANLTHLKERLIQSNAWEQKKQLDKKALNKLLADKIKATDFDQAKEDITPFIQDATDIDIWSKDFFLSMLTRIRITD